MRRAIATLLRIYSSRPRWLQAMAAAAVAAALLLVIFAPSDSPLRHS